MNRLDLSTCGNFVECWHNGQCVYTVRIWGHIAEAVGYAQEHFKQWTGEGGRISKELQSMIDRNKILTTRYGVPIDCDESGNPLSDDPAKYIRSAQ